MVDSSGHDNSGETLKQGELKVANEYIPLEKSIADLESKIDELKFSASTQAINLDKEIATLQKKTDLARKELFSSLSAYDTTQVARHPRRPNTRELIHNLCEDFMELHGDRNFQDDRAIIAGLGTIGSHSAVLIGHMKGHSTRENIICNFGMPKPEGYRKALRLMSMAERFSLPVITLIDTPGAYPGVDAEERGQSESIAKNIMVMAKLKIPIISIIVGEGGSGGALAIAVGNKVHMLEHAIYSVISPEGCASILFKSAAEAPKAAESLQLTAKRSLEMGIIDSIIQEPIGGAHRSPEETAKNIRKRILIDLAELGKMSPSELRSHRSNKFLQLGMQHIESNI